jgi:uncharacterized membrane protein YgcG
MGFAFLIVGAIMLILAMKGSDAISNFSDLVKNAFTSTNNFFVWIGAILVVAILGRVSGMTKAAKILIVLIIIVYLFANQGVFSKFSEAFANVTSPSPASQGATGQEIKFMPPEATVTPASGGGGNTPASGGSSATPGSGGGGGTPGSGGSIATGVQSLMKLFGK